MAPREIVVYLGKPQLVDREALRKSFMVHEVTSAEALLSVVRRRGARLSVVLLDLDSACQVNQGWNETSAATQGQAMIRSLKASAPALTICGVTSLEPLRPLLLGAGCDAVFASDGLVEGLSVPLQRSRAVLQG